MFDFLQACSMALNSSTVLFIGLSNASDPEFSTNTGYDSFKWSYIKNDITASYNFDHNTWTQHESLTYPSSNVMYNGVTIELDHGYEVLCSPYHGKNESKILAISFMVDNYQHYAQKYHPFAWTSSIDAISWNLLEIKNKNFNIPGMFRFLDFYIINFIAVIWFQEHLLV